MARTVDGENVEFSERVKQHAFFLNEQSAPRGCVGYWCRHCHFSSVLQKFFEVDHFTSVEEGRELGLSPDYIRSADNACILCTGCNGSKSKYKKPRPGAGLAYRASSQNMTWGELRQRSLDWDELVLMARRKGPYGRQE